MSVHDLLRELVETRGAGVVGDADQFRGALDDFLDEHEATRGEINLLVDAVRLGAVNRVVGMLDHGADAGAALDEVALALARDRGADSTTGSRWALGVITYALGRVGAEQVSSRPGGVAAPAAPVAAPAPAPGPAPAPAAAPPPVPEPRPASAPTPDPGPPTEPASPESVSPPEPASPPVRPPAPPTEEIASGPRTGTLPEPAGPPTEQLPAYGRPAAAPSASPAPSPPGETTRPRRGRALAVAAVVLLLLVGGAVAAVVLTGDGDGSGDTATEDDAGSGGSAEPAGGAVVPGGVLAPTQLVLPVREDDANTLYVVDTESGEAEQLTTGPDDRLPTISPDRRTVIYLEGAGSGTAGGLQPQVLDLRTGESRPLFDAESPCEYATRPAFSPGGDRLGVNCTDAAGDDAGTFVVGLDGQQIQQVVLPDAPRGALTWSSESDVLFAGYDGTEGAPSTIRFTDLDGTDTDLATEPDGATDVYPDYSAEQGGVLFQRSETTEDSFGEIWFASPTLDDGAPGERQLDVGRPAAQPTWSPDGSYLAFLVDTDGGERLATAPFADPGDVQVYDDLPGDPGAPAWGSR